MFAAAQAPRSAPSVEFVSEGAAFAPLISVSEGARVLWTFADGTTSDSVSPSKDYGTAASRTNTLRVTGGSLLSVNLGYGGEDGGFQSTVATEYAVNHADQHISEVRNLDVARESLVWWSSTGNADLEALDFTDFSALQRIESYYGALTTCVTSGCTALRRLCLEGCDVTHALDLRDAPIEDLRGTNNSFPTILWGDTANTWHICVQNVPGIAADAFPAMSELPLILEYFVTVTGRAGVIDLSGGFPAGRQGIVLMNYNAITGITLTGCSGLARLEAIHNEMDADAVGAVLVAFAGFDGWAGTLNLSGNAVPNAAGQAALATLLARGASVTVDT
jgi:hypothetical protein